MPERRRLRSTNLGRSSGLGTGMESFQGSLKRNLIPLKTGEEEENEEFTVI